MSLGRRLLIGAACLACGVLAQLSLQVHLGRAGDAHYPEVQGPLAGLPLQLTANGVSWRGQELQGLDQLRARLPYQADDLLTRVYQPAGGGPAVQLYAVHSRTGDDRKHHPEICIREVTGSPEDLAARKQIPLDPEGQRRVQRFRFRTGTDEYITVYYWHYTFNPLPRKGLTFLQLLHVKLSQPAPSMTVQVSSSAPLAQLEATVERSLLAALDAALSAGQLPENAALGCNRLPIGLVRE